MVPFLWREFIGQDGDKDEVINAEDDFKDDQGQQTDPDSRIK